MQFRIFCYSCKVWLSKEEVKLCGHETYGKSEQLFFECKYCRGCITKSADLFLQYRKMVNGEVVFEIPGVEVRER